MTVEYVVHSWDWADSTQAALFGDLQKLALDGVNLAGSGPDPTTGNIDVTVVVPSATDQAELSSALKLPQTQSIATLSAYAADAQTLIAETVGPDIVVSLVPQSVTQRLSSRITGDGADQGDYMTDNNGNQCTSGFSVNGRNNPNNFFTLTAGHCSWNLNTGYEYATSNWYVPGPPPGQAPGNYLGPTSHDYFCNDQDDVETIGSDPTVGPYVYGGTPGETNPPIYGVTGSIVPADGANITADGANSGEVRSIPVLNNNGFHTEGYTLCLGGTSTTQYVAHAVVFPTVDNGQTACQGGDSGGPIYQHETNGSEVAAVGDIDFTVGSDCYGETIGAETTDTTTNLLIIP